MAQFRQSPGLGVEPPPAPFRQGTQAKAAERPLVGTAPGAHVPQERHQLLPSDGGAHEPR